MLLAGGRHVPADPRRVRLRRGVRRRAQVPRDAALPERADLDQPRALLPGRARARPAALLLGDWIMKRVLRMFVFAAAFASVSVLAQEYPTRAVRMRVPIAPGSSIRTMSGIAVA